MRKQLLFLLTILLSLQGYSQIRFENGYFINNTNQRVDGLIKNMDWNSNPTKFLYKSSEDGDIKTEEINSTKEFGIDGISKFIRSTVNIDRSSENIRSMSDEREPNFKEETLFLKVLVEGEASLYEYSDGNLKRYFYTVDSSDVEQLVFKSYKISQGETGKNNTFRQQLFNNLECSTFAPRKLENVNYTQSDLVQFFIEFNECNSHSYTNFTKKQKRDFFNLSIRPGLNSSSLSIANYESKAQKIDFDNELSFRFGIEAEFIMPFNKNKWAIIVEPTYQYYKSDTEIEHGFTSVDYKSIEIPIGVRHYFFLNENSKIFLNAAYVLDLNINSTIASDFFQDLEVKTVNNIALGLGFKYDRYSLEIRYLTDRDLLSNYMYWNSNYKTVSVILGYSLF